MVNFKTVLTIMTIVSTSEKKSEYTGKISIDAPGDVEKLTIPTTNLPLPPPKYMLFMVNFPTLLE